MLLFIYTLYHWPYLLLSILPLSLTHAHAQCLKRFIESMPIDKRVVSVQSHACRVDTGITGQSGESEQHSMAVYEVTPGE